MYFWSRECAANIHTYANLSFPLISSKIGSKNKIINHSHFRTNTALRIKFHTLYFYKNYNNAQIHSNVSVQYWKSFPFVQKAWKTCVHTSVSHKNQSSSQTKGFKHRLIQKILETCEREANIFYTRVQIIHLCIIYTPCINQRMWTGLFRCKCLLIVSSYSNWPS